MNNANTNGDCPQSARRKGTEEADLIDCRLLACQNAIFLGSDIQRGDNSEWTRARPSAFMKGTI